MDNHSEHLTSAPLTPESRAELTDRALLECAAKVAGKHAHDWAAPGRLLPNKGGFVQFIGLGSASIWNPLTDDGDALRLAVKLRAKITIGNRITMVEVLGLPDVGQEWFTDHDGDRAAATRRAIVRAAARWQPVPDSPPTGDRQKDKTTGAVPSLDQPKEKTE
jgi:hypothetical protein